MRPFKIDRFLPAPDPDPTKALKLKGLGHQWWWGGEGGSKRNGANFAQLCTDANDEEMKKKIKFLDSAPSYRT
jgi:hypothetical protein